MRFLPPHPRLLYPVLVFLFLRCCLALNPVLPSNFPDPSVIQVDHVYYGFATRTSSVHVQVAEASNFTAWRLLKNYDALPVLPKWVSTSLPEVWAPDVKQLPDGSFVLYFAATSRRQIPEHYQLQHCIGAALSKTVLGPYNPLSKPLACDLEAGGAIDPYGFHDPVSGNHYLVYKVDGDSLGHNDSRSCTKYVAPTPLLLQQVDIDGVSLIGKPVELLLNSRYDGPSIEAPALLFHDNKYFLIHNSRCYAYEEYTVHYAISYDGINGPYHRGPRPLLLTGQQLDGAELHAPGGVDLDPSNSSRLVFHSDTNLDWFKLRTFNPAGRNRAMFAAELHVDNAGFLTAKVLRS